MNKEDIVRLIRKSGKPSAGLDEALTKKVPDFSRTFNVGGRNRTRTCDPIDVNDVLCLGGKVCRKQMLGVHMPKNVDITEFLRFLAHPSGVRRMGVHRVFTPF